MSSLEEIRKLSHQAQELNLKIGFLASANPKDRWLRRMSRKACIRAMRRMDKWEQLINNTVQGISEQLSK